MNPHEYKIAIEIANNLEGYPWRTDLEARCVLVSVRDLAHGIANILADNSAEFDRARFLEICGF
jgi:hypothetical protein